MGDKSCVQSETQQDGQQETHYDWKQWEKGEERVEHSEELPQLQVPEWVAQA